MPLNNVPYKRIQFNNMQFKNSDHLALNLFYKKYKDKARARPTDSVHVAIEGDVIHAGLRLLSYGDYFFLRSVFTAPAIRGQGVASKLLSHTLSEYSQPIYTLPTLAALGLYQRLGFKVVEEENIPAELVASYRRFRQSSPASTVMVINN
jgi:N-acetylglutamate synthase-like GNAT family acetyltransferase